MEHSPSYVVMKFMAHYGTRRFITVFTRACHWSLSWQPDESTSHPNSLFSLRLILILFTHLRLGLRRGFFPSGFPTKILYVFLISHIC